MRKKVSPFWTVGLVVALLGCVDDQRVSTDYCPEDDLKLRPGICGCGTPDTDGDGNTIPDCLEANVPLSCTPSCDVDGKFVGCDADGNVLEAEDCAAAGKVCGKDAEGQLGCVVVETPVTCTPACDVDGKFVGCDADGNVLEAEDCAAAGKVCGKDAEGQLGCVDPSDCTVGEGEAGETVAHNAYVCTEEGRKICNNGVLMDAACENNGICQADGTCVDCLEGDTKCVIEDGVHKQYTCGADKTWGEGVACEEGSVCDTAEPSKTCRALGELVSCGESYNACATVHGVDYMVYCEPSGNYAEACMNGQRCIAGKWGGLECTELSLETGACGTSLQECTAADDPAQLCVGATYDPNAKPKPGSESLVCAESGEKGCMVNADHCMYCGDGVVDSDSEMCDFDSDWNPILKDGVTCADVEGLDASKTYIGTPGCMDCALDQGSCVEQHDWTYTTIKAIRNDYDKFIDVTTCGGVKEAFTAVKSIEVTGVVTAIRSNSMGFFMEDIEAGQEAGILVYCADGSCVDDLAVGDKVTVKADAVGHYYCEVQVRAATFENPLTVTKLESGVTFTPAVITSADLNVEGNKANSTYSSRLVTISNVTTGEAFGSKPNGWPVIDAVGSTIIGNYLLSTLKNSMAASTQYSSVTGVVVYSFNTNTVAPRTVNDIGEVIVKSCTEADNKCEQTEAGAVVSVCGADGHVTTTTIAGVSCAGKVAGVCLNGAKQCKNDFPQTCTNGAWVDGETCAGFCVNGVCQ